MWGRVGFEHKTCGLIMFLYLPQANDLDFWLSASDAVSPVKEKENDVVVNG